MKKLVIYSGGFVPFSPHHYKAWSILNNSFNVTPYIATSNYSSIKRSMSFDEKKQVMMQFGISENYIYEVKSPYRCNEIVSFFDPDSTILIYGIGEKDQYRLSGGSYFKKYDETVPCEPLSKNGYYYIIPNISIKLFGEDMSGTTVRRFLTSCDKNQFESSFGWYNESVYNMLKSRFGTLTESWITKTQLKRIEQYIDSFFKQFNIDINFQNLYTGTHFFQRLNDPRNNEPITQDDLRKIFKKASLRYGLQLSKLNAGAEGVLKDMETDINIPFIIKWDTNNQEIDLIPKTIMRKPNFKSTTPFYSVESANKTSKHLLHVYEDRSITFKTLMEISNNICNNKCDLFEKTDGQNLQITIRNGNVLSRRNKTTTKNPMTIDVLERMYEGRGNLKDSFVNAHKDMQSLLNRLPHIKELIENNNLFINMEILNPLTANVFQYGSEPKIMLHDLIEYDIKGNEIKRLNKSGIGLYNEIKSYNLTKQDIYTIIPPNKLQLENSDIIFKWFSKNIKEYMIKNSLSESDSIFGHNYIIELIDKFSYNLLNIIEGTLSITNMKTKLDELLLLNENLEFELRNKYDSNFERLKTIISNKLPNNFEGFVFEYDNKIYKMTGSFRYLNQLLGIKRYKR